MFSKSLIAITLCLVASSNVNAAGLQVDCSQFTSHKGFCGKGPTACDQGNTMFMGANWETQGRTQCQNVASLTATVCDATRQAVLAGCCQR
eukprot:Pgem_evm1s1923